MSAADIVRRLEEQRVQTAERRAAVNTARNAAVLRARLK